MSQYLLNRLGSCRLFPQSVFTACARSFVSHAAAKRAPPRQRGLQSAEDFLKSIGRVAETKVKVEKWKEFWGMDGHTLKKAGLAVRDRRYILWCMEKYRQGLDPADFAHEPKPKKKIRGHGPAVQNGKRIRSRRLR
ncbi:hypothetical protein DFH11DRAFT_210591 [Phellopilus nigrolimitatus]|nr:hypothetical protein DFH11DRAFT_210591 [Phellopilus nigrolimitatus]